MPQEPQWPVHEIKASFAGGEFTPALAARVDIAKYSTGLKTARNVNIMPQGGVRNRPGTYFVAAAGDSAHAVRIIPFVYATGDAYILEFGQYYIRMFKDGERVIVDPADVDNFDPTETYPRNSIVKVGSYVAIYWNGVSEKYLTAYAPYGTDITDYAADVDVSGGADCAVTVTSGNKYLHFRIGSTAANNSAANFQTKLRALGGTFANWFVVENSLYAAARPTTITAGFTTFYENNTLWVNGVNVITGTSGVSIFPLKMTFAESLSWQAWSDQITTTYTGAELKDLKVTQSADYLYICHPDHAPAQFIRLANMVWTIEPFPYVNGPFMLQNTDSTKTLSSNSMTPGSITQTISQVVARPDWLMTGYNGIDLVTASAHGLSTGNIVTVSSLDGALAATLNGNSYTITVVNSTRFSLGISHSTFSTYTPGAGTISTDGPVTITANFDIFDASHVGALFQLVETLPAQSISEAPASTVATSSIQCGHTWRIITNGNSWTGVIKIYASVDGGTTWNLLRTLQGNAGAGYAENFDTSGDTGYSQCLIRAIGTYSASTATITLSSDTFDWVGIIKIDTVSSPTSATATILTQNNVGIGLASTNATYQWAEGSWSNYRGWPTVCTFFQDRLAFASTVSEPQTVWFSQTGDYSNFGVSYPIIDSDALSILLPSRTVNIVKNMSSLSAMVVLTSDSDFSIDTGQSGTLSPTSVSVICHGHRGASEVTPAVVGNELILVQQMGTIIRNLIYQFAVSGYMGDNISVVSQHLFTGYQIVEMAYQQEPDSIVWAVRNDGTLLSLTYMREQEVIAWTHHDTQGTFESVASIPNSTLGINEIWFVVNRTVGGNTVRYIERLAPRDMGMDAEDYMMLDSAVTQDNGSSPSVTVTGLSHLNGKTVNALADGNVVIGLTVANGSVTLPVAASLVHVGLSYISDVETLRIESPDTAGTLQGRRVAIPRVTLRFWNSRGGHIGITNQNTSIASTGTTGLDEIIQREPGERYDAAIPLKTQDYLFVPNGGYDFGTSVFYRQTDPLPFCLLAIIPQIVRGEN